MNLDRRRLRPALVLPTDVHRPGCLRTRPAAPRPPRGALPVPADGRTQLDAGMGPGATGHREPIEIVTPYDGHEHVTREAVADVERRLQGRGPADAADKDDSPPPRQTRTGRRERADENVVEALIGHLRPRRTTRTPTSPTSSASMGGSARTGSGCRCASPDLADTDALMAGRLRTPSRRRLRTPAGTPEADPDEDRRERCPTPTTPMSDEDLLKAITRAGHEAARPRRRRHQDVRRLQAAPAARPSRFGSRCRPGQRGRRSPSSGGSA